MRVTFTHSGFTAVERVFGVLMAPFGGGLMKMVGVKMEEMVKRRIASEKTSPDGKPWQPNKAGTSILYRTGGLYGSITHTSSPLRATVGTNWPYAHVHQFGMTIHARHGRMRFTYAGSQYNARTVRIPARPFMGLSAANLAELRVAIDAYMSRWLPWR